MSNLFSLQGNFYSSIRNATTGKPGKMTWLGNASVATMALETDKSDKNESFSGSRLLYGSLQRSKSARLSITLDEWLPENLALGLYGTQVDVTGASIVAEALPAGLVAGDMVAVDKGFISAVTVKDSTGVPLVLVAGTDYSVVSAGRGIIKIIDPTGFVQPFTVDYTYANAKSLAMFSTVTPPERYVIFDGVNTITGEKVLMDLFRMQFDPVTDFGLINDDFGSLQLEAVALYDTVNALDANLGGFGRIRTQVV